MCSAPDGDPGAALVVAIAWFALWFWLIGRIKRGWP